MRLGIRTLAVLALIGCSSNDIPTPTGVTSTAHTDVTGTWTMTWGPMTGHFVVEDTTISGVDTTITNRLVFDTCNASGTMTLTQQSPVANVIGTYTMTRTCNDTLVFPDAALGDTVPAGVARAHSDSAWKSLVTAGDTFYLFLDNNLTRHDPAVTPSATPFKQGQQTLVNGNSMSGVAVWANMRFKHSPKDTTAQTVPLTGTFSATRP